MSMPSSVFPMSPDLSRSPACTDIGAVLHAFRHLVGSSEPAVVFTSLAALSAEVLSHECLVYLQEGDLRSYLISSPAAVADLNSTAGDTLADYLLPHLAERTIRTPLEASATHDRPGYHGVVVHRWHAPYRPTEIDAALAQAAVDRATALVDRERAAEHTVHMEAQVAHLETALKSNRTIGAAMGILMITHRINEPQAFDLLRTTSQNTHRKLRDIADEVVFTGELPRLAGR